MNKLRRYWKRIELFRVISFNTGAGLLRMLFTFGTNKIIALWLGPAGTALTSQILNAIQGLQGFATLGISEAVTRYTALYRKRDNRLRLFLLRSGRMILYISALLGLFVFFLAPQVSHYLFGTRDYASLVRVMAVFSPVYAYQMLLMAVLNGLEQYRRLSIINILVHATGFVLMIFLAAALQLRGALWAVVLTPVVSFGFSLLILRPYDRHLLVAPLQNGNDKFDGFLKRLAPYLAMALTVAVMRPFFSLYIRNAIIAHFGPEGTYTAGYWDAIRKISAFYFVFIAPVFSVYYFPRLTRINDAREWISEIKRMLRHFFGWIFAGFVLVFALRRWITTLVFADDYAPVNALYGWQIAGDAIRVFSLLLAYRMWAKALSWHFVISEVGYWLLYTGLVMVFMPVGGLFGVMEAYVWANAGYLILMLIYFRKELLEGLFQPPNK